jgi:hypothetical protein
VDRGCIRLFDALSGNAVRYRRAAQPGSADVPGIAGVRNLEGELQFGSQTIRIYYEHTLSYLALISDSEPMLQKIANRLQPLLALVITAPLAFDAQGRLRAAVHASPAA